MKRRLASAGLLALGLTQMAGDLLRVAPLRAVGAATAASPAPKVFSAVHGLETYSTRFFLEWNGHDGSINSLELTPERYSKLRGPYNRRNVFGAALAYGPVLSSEPATRPAFLAIMGYALCGEAPVLREMGIDTATIASSPRVRYEPRPGTVMGDLPRVITAPCGEGPQSPSLTR